MRDDVNFHKLVFRIDPGIINNKDNYFNKIVEKNGYF